MRLSSLYTSLVVAGLLALSIGTYGAQAPPASGGRAGGAGDQAAGRGRGRGAEIPPWAILRAPAGVKEGDTWIPEMPAMDALRPPPGWQPDGNEVPWMPATLLRLPRTNITRAKYPAIDFHNHTGSLRTREQYDAVVKALDSVGVGAVVNLNGGTGDELDAVLKAGEPYRDRVANFVTFNGVGINEPGWSERFAALMERGFKAGAMGMKVSKQLGQELRNPGWQLHPGRRSASGSGLGNGREVPEARADSLERLDRPLLSRSVRRTSGMRLDCGTSGGTRRAISTRAGRPTR